MRHYLLFCLLACLGFAVSSCKKDAPPDAKEWEGKPGKRDLLER